MTSSGPRKRKVALEEDVQRKKVKINKNNSASASGVSKQLDPVWQDFELLAEQQQLDLNVSKNVVQLFKEGNTVPFIARYRRAMTGDMSPETLRDIKEEYEAICALKTRITTVIKAVDKQGQLNKTLQKSICAVRSAEELEHIYAPFKPGGKRTLAEKAKELGLEAAAIDLLNNTKAVSLEKYIKPKEKGLSKLEDVEQGVVHIIAFTISTDTDLLKFMRDLRQETSFMIETKKTKNSHEDVAKFENYYDYKIPVKYVKPHQVLAINRGESLKILSVKIVVPDFVFKKFSYFCTNKWNYKGPNDANRRKILDEAIQDSYKRLVQPLIVREVRAELKVKAEKASYDVFSTNLKHLLLAPPLKGKPILAIDPGYANGCKVAVVSPTGSLLGQSVIYPHTKKKPHQIHSIIQETSDEQVLKKLLIDYNCELICLGNGTACRSTETWLSNQIQANFFKPLDVQYTIVNEEGASIYSCSAEAKKEFPDLDVNIISAISLARRIQDPLAELVKVEPKHLGVGMYQHDLKKARLEEALDEVVSECVSFVGVDLNTASQCLLRRIAGLSDKKATNIIQYREEKGCFTYRKQLMDVKGIGPKVFEQCAGFLRVGPLDRDKRTFYKQAKTTKLDGTDIHPESYELTEKMLKTLNLDVGNVGDGNFINAVKAMSLQAQDLAFNHNAEVETIRLILEALTRPLNHDIRHSISQTPLFKKGVTSILDLKLGTVLTGRVSNVTHFGCFVDIGVGSNGLIHSTKLKGLSLQIGNCVEVKVLKVEQDKKRISLEAIKIL